MKNKALISAILTIALCLSIISGSTFALFTSESKVNVAITAGNVEVVANVDDIELYSMGELRQTDSFANGGTAEYDETTGEVLLNKVTPGDKVKFNLYVTNNSDVNIQYRVSWIASGELYSVLVATADGATLANGVSEWKKWDYNPADTERVIPVSIELPTDAGNEHRGKSAAIAFKVEAVQGNGVDFFKSEVSSAADLRAALLSGGDIVLNEDVVLDENTAMEIAENSIAVIDLNGKTITAKNDKATGAVITNKGSLTIIGGSITNDAVNGGAVIDNKGSLVLDGVSITGAAMTDAGYPEYAVCSTGSLTIEEGTSVTSDRGALNLSGKTVINGGEFKVTNAAGTRNITLHTLAAKAGSDVTIYGGTFTNEYEGVSGASVICPWGGNITVWGGDFRDPIADTADFNNVANFQNYMGSGSVVSVMGGTYNDNTVEANLASGYTATYDDVTGIYTVNAKSVTAGTASSAIAGGGNLKLDEDVTYSNKIENDTVIDLNGNAFNAGGTLELKNNANLTMSGGDYVVNGTYGHVDVRPSSEEGSTVVYEDVDFSYNKKNNTYGPSTNRLGTVVEVCATVTGAKTVIVFKNCTFTNAQVLFEGLSGKVGEFEATFENCTFTALTSSAPIYVQNYVTGTINLIGCTFNLECTSSSASAVSVSSSTSTSVTINAQNNTINAVKATPTDGSVTGVDVVKVNGAVESVGFISCGDNTEVNETGTTKTGIAK